MTTQGRQRILLEPGTVVNMTERNRNYPESRFATKKAQDVGPATNPNRRSEVGMRNQASKREANYYPNYSVSFKLASEVAIVMPPELKQPF